MKVAIVIPAYNEEKRIGKTLDAYSKYFTALEKKTKLKYEIIVVINGTTDSTEKVVKYYQKRNRSIRYLNLVKGGKGYAILEGFKIALEKKHDLIGFVDADMATPPEAFHALINQINSFDGVIASRWMKGSIIKTPQTLLRKITSRGFNMLVRLFLSLSFADTQCGAKLFTRNALSSVISSVGTTRWAFDIDLLYQLKRKGYKIKEIPTIWEDKKESKLNLTKVPFQMFAALVRLRLLYSPFRFLVVWYNKLPEKLKMHNTR